MFQFQKHAELFHGVCECEQHGLAFIIIFGTSCMLLEHQCLSLASSWHQPLLLTWSSRKCLQIFYYSTCLAGGEIQLLKKTWLKHICRTLEVIQPRLSKKLCNQHPFRHREPEHKLNWCQRAKAPLASLLKVQLQIAPAVSIPYKHRQCHLSTRAGTALFFQLPNKQLFYSKTSNLK